MSNFNHSSKISLGLKPKRSLKKTRALCQIPPLPNDTSGSLTADIFPSKESLSLIREEFSDDSSDEDYVPDSEIAQSQVSGRQLDNDADNRFMQRKETSDLANSVLSPDKSEESEIGNRTRSKLILKDTPLESIEGSFTFPDITTDMYDNDCDEEWSDFLKEFFQPTGSVADLPEDDAEDPEYKILPDEEEAVDLEEFRMDKGVKVSRKELNDLVAELFTSLASYVDDVEVEVQESSREELNKDQTEFSKELPDNVCSKISSDKETCQTVENVLVTMSEIRDQVETTIQEGLTLTYSQRLLLDQQIRQHVQLNTQHFLQCFKHPILSKFADAVKIMLIELKTLSGSNENSAFNAINLDKAVFLINKWERCYEDTKFRKSFQSKWLYREFHPDVMRAMGTGGIFLYPLLLPSRPFQCNTAPAKISRLFVPEQRLLVIGLKEFGAYVAQNMPELNRKQQVEQTVRLIALYLMPPKSSLSLLGAIKGRKCSKRDGPLHEYLRKTKLPLIKHYVIPLTSDSFKPLWSRSLSLMPTVWKRYVRQGEKHKKRRKVLSSR